MKPAGFLVSSPLFPSRRPFIKKNKMKTSVKWKGVVIEKGGNSKHHLFNFHEVRKQLTKLFGNPKTKEEHDILHDRCKKVMDKMPCFMLDEENHKEYHKKYDLPKPRKLWRKYCK